VSWRCAGIPWIITLFITDQAFWGRQAEQIGASTTPIPYNRLDVQNLAQAIRRAVEDDGLRQSCASLGGASEGRGWRGDRGADSGKLLK
jgi:UDP:flavonoid glycosyltransferase YjiC (YdhE family)